MIKNLLFTRLMVLVLTCCAAISCTSFADSVSSCEALEEFILQSKSPTYIEVSGALHKNRMFENLPRLTFLLDLVKNHNAPADLPAALRLVFPQTVVVAKENSIFITDKELTQSKGPQLMNEHISIPRFDGDLESLCGELKRMGHTLRYNPEQVNGDTKVFGGGAYRPEHLPVRLRDFSGSMRELLRLVVQQRQSPMASYIARVNGHAPQTIELDVFCVGKPTEPSK